MYLKNKNIITKFAPTKIKSQIDKSWILRFSINFVYDLSSCN